MGLEVIFAAHDNRLQIVRELVPGPRGRRARTQYDVRIDDEQLLQPTSITLSRDNLVALHYALTLELARVAEAYGPRHRTILDAMAAINQPPTGDE